ncbi:MAG: general secretion pathway protein GspB [Candidatus Thiodiazotropha sp. (ex Lucinoma borealis)]|nr:general secretion pathway protein GspB [Candidatus Thiodiazotropha sp. (ex Lucinoma borealis)]
MSSILDALERASQERQPGKENILPGANPLPPDNSYWLPGLLIVVILLLIVAIGYWFISQKNPSPVDVPVSHPDEAVLKSSPREFEQKKINEAVLPAKQPVTKKAETTADRIRHGVLPNQRTLVSEAVVSQVTDDKKKEQVEPTQVQTTTTITQSAAKIDNEAIAIASVEIPVVKEISDIKDERSPVKPRIQASIQQKAGGSEARPVQSTPVEQPEINDSESQIPLIWELPQGLREELGQLKTSIHVYNKEPEQRFVIINLHRYGEGDVLSSKGYRLKRIDRDGIVVDYGEGLVRLLREKY